jgi:hypothetical protein
MGKNAKARAAAAQPRKKDVVDMENIYSEDPNRLDMIANLTSSRLLEISERFDMYPSATQHRKSGSEQPLNGQVDCAQFVKLMTDIMGNTEIGRRADFPEKLVDLFFRASKNSDKT